MTGVGGLVPPFESLQLWLSIVFAPQFPADGAGGPRNINESVTMMDASTLKVSPRVVIHFAPSRLWVCL